MTQSVLPVEVLDYWLETRMAEVHTAMPCKVLSYDASEQTADVRPQVTRRVLDEDDVPYQEALPDLYGIPVAFPRAGGFHMTFPLAADDYVLVIFSEEATIAWRDRGEQIDPGIYDRHGLNGPFALPCGFPDKSKLGTAPSTSNMVMGADDGDAAVVVKPSEVLLGDSTATDLVALASLVDSLFTKIDTVFRTGWIPVAMDGGAALKTAWIAGPAFPTPPSSVAAAKTKAK